MIETAYRHLSDDDAIKHVDAKFEVRSRGLLETKEEADSDTEEKAVD